MRQNENLYLKKIKKVRCITCRFTRPKIGIKAFRTEWHRMAYGWMSSYDGGGGGGGGGYTQSKTSVNPASTVFYL